MLSTSSLNSRPVDEPVWFVSRPTPTWAPEGHNAVTLVRLDSLTRRPPPEHELLLLQGTPVRLKVGAGPTVTGERKASTPFWEMTAPLSMGSFCNDSRRGATPKPV